MTRATTSERRIARNARLTERDSVMLPDDATAALLLIPAVSINRNFCKNDHNLALEPIKIRFMKERALKLKLLRTMKLRAGTKIKASQPGCMS